MPARKEDETDQELDISRQEVAPLRFGTGGIRAVMGSAANQLNEGTIAAISQAVSGWVHSLDKTPKVAIARDCREGGAEFLRVAAEVLAGNGIEVLVLPNVQPTPVLCFATRDLGCAAGIVITASHNAREYNGYKVYDHWGCQATDDITQRIQALLEENKPVRRMSYEQAASTEMLHEVGEEVLDRYVHAASKAVFPICKVGDSLHVVYSPLNGTGAPYVLQLFERQGLNELTVVPQQERPDGTFPTCPVPNPEEAEALVMGAKLCGKLGADILLATDPDADRVGVAVMHKGHCQRLSGDEIALLLFDWTCRMRQECGELGAEKIAYSTVVSTPLLDNVASCWGVQLRRTLTGFKYIGEQSCLLEQRGELDRFLLGMEESCGYLVGPYLRDKDGMSAAAAVANMALWHKKRGLTLCDALRELYESYGWCLGRQVGIRLEHATTDELMGQLRAHGIASIADARVERMIDYLPGVPMPGVAGEKVPMLPPANVLELQLSWGKVLVRPSGTEPKIKAYVFAFAASEQEAMERLEHLTAGVRRLLSVD